MSSKVTSPEKAALDDTIAWRSVPDLPVLPLEAVEHGRRRSAVTGGASIAFSVPVYAGSVESGESALHVPFHAAVVSAAVVATPPRARLRVCVCVAEIRDRESER